MHDFLIVGSGLFGAVFAHQAKQVGKSCLVIDKRSMPGGNVACEKIEGINVHLHGAHIFHTNDETIWKFVNSFVPFNNYTHTVVANYKGKIFNLPFNMNTFYQMWRIADPGEASKKIEAQRSFKRWKGCKYGNYTVPINLEQQTIELVGTDLYKTIVKEYTEKQWGRKCTELLPFIIKRLPVRFTYDNRYFSDRFQGIPIGGYNPLISGLLSGIEVRLNTDYFANPDHFKGLARTVVYTGPLDQFYGFKFGDLEYRSLSFKTILKDRENYQGCAVMNYTSHIVPYTRTIEHKHFEDTKSPVTVVSYEYPQTWDRSREPYYPINDPANDKLYRMYSTLANAEANVIFGGRLAEYRYYDMHQVVASALKASRLAIA